MRVLRAVMSASLLTTEAILLVEGRAQEALPLHLCSVSAIVALALSFGAGDWSLDFLWYLGMPGALLALVFPAPAVSRYQPLLNASYVTTHALIIVIPAWAIAKGRRVRRGRERAMLLALHALAAAAYAANLALGTDYLFLMAPPAGTPLCVPYAWGYPFYLLTLEALAFALVAVTGRGMARLFPGAMK